ncbi:Polypeptide N-acetylgalactosaminyltransferase 9 [Vulpes lagopus]
MAVARRIKTLLTVNILVFVGIILFSVYCRLQDRSEGLVQTVRSAGRMRPRHTGVGAPLDREAILQRLDHLEEVVYNQLNGEPGALPGARGCGRLSQVPGTAPCAPAPGTLADPRARRPTGAGVELPVTPGGDRAGGR